MVLLVITPKKCTYESIIAAKLSQQNSWLCFFKNYIKQLVIFILARENQDHI